MSEKIMIYLDACCFNRPYDCQSNIQIKLETEAKIYLQFLIRNKKITLVWSYILEHENNQNPYQDRRSAIQNWKSYANDFILENESILRCAEKFKQLGFKTKDALHIGCAIEAGCKYFITTDYKMIAKRSLISEVNILNPLDMLQILGGNGNENEK